eukprot:g826.t1
MDLEGVDEDGIPDNPVEQQRFFQEEHSSNNQGTSHRPQSAYSDVTIVFSKHVDGGVKAIAKCEEDNSKTPQLTNRSQSRKNETQVVDIIGPGGPRDALGLDPRDTGYIGAKNRKRQNLFPNAFLEGDSQLVFKKGITKTDFAEGKNVALSNEESHGALESTTRYETISGSPGDSLDILTSFISSKNTPKLNSDDYERFVENNNGIVRQMSSFKNRPRSSQSRFEDFFDKRRSEQIKISNDAKTNDLSIRPSRSAGSSRRKSIASVGSHIVEGFHQNSNNLSLDIPASQKGDNRKRTRRRPPPQSPSVVRAKRAAIQRRSDVSYVSDSESTPSSQLLESQSLDMDALFSINQKRLDALEALTSEAKNADVALKLAEGGGWKKSLENKSINYSFVDDSLETKMIGNI